MPQSPPNVGFVSLGCPKALVDSERILTQLRAEGYEIAPDYQQANLVVVNTCGFIDAAALGELGVRLHYVYPYPHVHVDELIPLMTEERMERLMARAGADQCPAAAALAGSPDDGADRRQRG